MKKNLIVVCLVFLITGLASAQIGAGRTMYVAVRTIALKSSTGLFAGTVTTLNYGDEVTVVQVNGRSVEVKSAADPSLTGWAPSANFSTKKIISGSTTSTSAREFALAGKGFNQEVENSYSTQGELNFAEVDKIESIKTDEADLLRFIEEGRLSAGK
jgi:uncharacterized protein YgiM (DUF1202 family)